MPPIADECLVLAKQPPALNIPAGSTVSHSSGRKILFDLGTRKDLENLPPSIVDMISTPGWTFEVEKDVAEIFEENGIATSSIEAVIWSHWHFDHTGNMKTFPPSVDLVVGPGFKNALLPGYPVNKESHLLESDWGGRNLVELEFNTEVKLGRFSAIDYFNDGSFYLLDAPGHAVGHICGLARVSKGHGGEDDSFVFMGADTCHHVYDAAVQSIHDMQEFDAAKNVLVLIAHDTAPLKRSSGFKFFPSGDLNNWKQDRLDDNIRWTFLEDFPTAVENGAQQEMALKEGLSFKPQ
ncbi:metallo-beta-lactamase superfamily protein [Thozetella sp. PMI_491]|nr:metallo-beta-lactamase superfamily protein [Thozetella sp. PMI_491]